MSKCLLFQVADTRFAVRCEYAPFTDWLTEKYRAFISQEEPDLRLNVRFDIIPQSRKSSPSLYAVRNGNHHEYEELMLSVTCQRPTDFFAFMLQMCLRSALLAENPINLLIHSSGVVLGGMAYLFLGPSGSGKSTICRLLAPERDFTIIHDEAIAISLAEERFVAWSTPFRGEMPTRHNISAPLQAIFSLKHDHTNYATRITSRKAVALVSSSLIPPMIATGGNLEIHAAESLRLALKVAESTPCYELHFKPERGFWECLPQLFKENSPKQK